MLLLSDFRAKLSALDLLKRVEGDLRQAISRAVSLADSAVNAVQPVRSSNETSAAASVARNLPEQLVQKREAQMQNAKVLQDDVKESVFLAQIELFQDLMKNVCKVGTFLHFALPFLGILHTLSSFLLRFRKWKSYPRGQLHSLVSIKHFLR